MDGDCYQLSPNREHTVAGVEERERSFIGGSSYMSAEEGGVDVPISTPPLDLLVTPVRLE